METMTQKRARVIVQGYVQGVGYRYFALKLARQLDLAGWVRNREDGSVELEVEGEESTIHDFTQKLGVQHPWAKVDNMEIQWEPFDGKLQSFEIKF